MNYTKSPIEDEETKVDIIAASAPLMFVLSCVVLAYTNAIPLSIYPVELIDVAESIYSASSLMYVTAAISLFLLFAMGLPPIRYQLPGLLVAVVSTIAIIFIASFQLGELAIMFMVFSMVIPVGNWAYSKLTSKLERALSNI